MKRTNFINKKKSEQSGITLIALVLTIIILLILAGVAIATLTGDNGLLQKATTAKEANEEAKELELIKLAVSAAQVAGEGTITKDNLESELKINFNDNTITIGEIEDGWSYNSYKIDKSGEVDKLLPKEYQQVEYIESTGTQWVDSKINSSNDLTIDITLCALNYSSSGILGSRTNDGNCQIAIFFYDSGNQWGAFVRHANGTGSNANVKIGNLRLNQKYKIVISNEEVFVDDNYIAKIQKHKFNDSGYTMSIFSFRNSSTGELINGCSEIKLYNLKVIKENNIFKDFIPCYSTTTVTDVDGIERPKDTMGLYDTVEGKFYVNKGTGTFGYETLDGTYVAPTNN